MLQRSLSVKYVMIHRRRKRGGQGGPGPPNNLGGGGPTYPLAPPIIHPPFQFLCEAGKNHKCTKLKGKIIINVTLI